MGNFASLPSSRAKHQQVSPERCSWEEALEAKQAQLQRKEQELEKREQLLGTQSDSGKLAPNAKGSLPQDDFVSSLAARVVLLEQEKHRMEGQVQLLEGALDAALAKRVPGSERPLSTGNSQGQLELTKVAKEEPPTERSVVSMLERLIKGYTPTTTELLNLRDSVLLCALRGQQQPQHKMQNQIVQRLRQSQTVGDEEVHAALVQLLNDQSEADFIEVLNQATAPDHPPLPGMTYAEWLTGQRNPASDSNSAYTSATGGRPSPLLPNRTTSGLPRIALQDRDRLSEQGHTPTVDKLPSKGAQSSRGVSRSNPGMSAPQQRISMDGQAHERRFLPLQSVKERLTKSADEDKELCVMREPSDHVLSCLAKIDDWHFDAFELDEATNGRPLSMLAYALFSRKDLFKKFQISEICFVRFLQKIEANYSPGNPYHNAIHAADVLRTLHVITTRGGVSDVMDKASDIALIATYLAAIIHDYEHRGVNNDFLVKSRHELAIRYNDRSPMENHHLAASWAMLLSFDDCQVFKHTNQKVLEVLRRMVVDLVLATDMKQHFALTSLWTSKIPILVSSGEPTIGTPPRPGSRPSSGRSKKAWAEEPSSPSRLAKFVVEDEELRTLVLQTAMKCADLGHLTHTWEVHKRWVEALEEEMWRQGDQERARGMPISPLMDRNKAGITKSQQGFFDFVVLPQFRGFCKVFPKCQPMLDMVERNYEIWSE